MVGLPKVKRGGGPKTVSGKLASSRNSIKTGSYSTSVTIPGESEEDFQQFFDEFVESLSPQGVLEQSMVHELAVIAWKKHRLDRLEQSGLSRVLSSPVTAYELKHDMNVFYGCDWLIADLSAVTDVLVLKSSSNLAFINKLSDYGISKDDFFQLPMTNPELYQLIVDFAKKTYSLDSNFKPIPEQLFRLNTTNEDGISEAFVHYVIRQIKKRSEQVLWVNEHLEELKSAIQAYRERRLLKIMQDVGLMRARDDLGRAFSRTLAEFRRQQQWRIKLAVDVSPISE